MGPLPLMAGTVFAAVVWSVLLVRRVVRNRQHAYPDQLLHQERVRSAGYTGAAIIFLPSLIASTGLGGLLGALLLEPIARITGHGFLGMDLGFGVGTAIGTAALTALGASLAIRFFAKPEIGT